MVGVLKPLDGSCPTLSLEKQTGFVTGRQSNIYCPLVLRPCYQVYCFVEFSFSQWSLMGMFESIENSQLPFGNMDCLAVAWQAKQ